MKRRLAILSEIIAPYRIPVFNALAGRNEVELYVIFLSETDPSLRQWQVYREEIRFSYEILRSFRRRIGKFNVLLTGGVGAALGRRDPKIIVAGGYSYLATWQAQWWARRRGVPYLLWSESNATDARRKLWPVEAAKRKFIRACQGFVVPGSSAAKYLKSFGAPQDSIFVAPNAVDVQLFAKAAEVARRDGRKRKQLGLPEHYFLYVGRFVRAKGVFDLLSAYATLPEDTRQAVSLVLVGDGEERMELVRRSREIDGGSNVLFPGFVQRDELAAFYAAAEALVFPTHTDPWGFVVNEALACGLPVISTDVAGCTADLVRDGVNGYVVGSRKPELLSQAMLKLLRDPELPKRMGQASRERSASFTPELWAEGVVRAVVDRLGGSHG